MRAAIVTQAAVPTAFERLSTFRAESPFTHIPSKEQLGGAGGESVRWHTAAPHAGHA
jgi:hypothetical protein